jgi:hypothetical protein
MEAPLAGDPVNERGVFFKMFKKMASMIGLSYVFFKNKSYSFNSKKNIGLNSDKLFPSHDLVKVSS